MYVVCPQKVSFEFAIPIKSYPENKTGDLCRKTHPPRVNPKNFVSRICIGSSYLCWAFSCASMLRASCSILIKKLFEAGKITNIRKEMCLDFIMSDEKHEKLRNLIAMILLPKKLHKHDDSQAAFLRAAVSRVTF